MTQSTAPDLGGKLLDMARQITGAKTTRAFFEDIDNYIDGSILRITLRNFVTYDHCDFFPGPRLNMVIGPNGTGKSSLVCAMVLGLGGKPDLLGRAKDVGEFVKHGAEHASIQLRLRSRRPPHAKRGYVTLQRNITRAGNVSRWLINGEDASQRTVQDLVRSLRIQVDNLCQFLPQDRVSEFAHLSPARLLVETQRAASGGDSLAQAHDELVELRREERDLALKLTDARSHLSREEERMSLLQRDVTRHQEYERVQHRIRLMELKVPFLQYGEARDAYSTAVAERKEARAQHDAIKGAGRPLEEERTCMETRTADARKEREASEGRMRAWTAREGGAETRRASLTSAAEALSAWKRREAEARRKAEARRLKETEIREEIRIREAKICSLREKVREAMNVGQDDVDGDDADVSNSGRANNSTNSTSEASFQDIIHSRAHRLNDKMHELRREIDTSQEEARAIQARGDAWSRRKEEADRELRRMNNVTERRLEILGRADPVAVQVARELMEGKSPTCARFHTPPSLPIICEVGLKDPRYGRVVGSVIPRGIQRAFICHSPEDYDTFTREFIDHRKLRVTVYQFDPDRRPETSSEAHLDEEEVRRRYGFDGYISSMIEASPLVRRALEELCHIHQTPVLLSERDGKLDQERIERDGLLRAYYLGDQKYTLRRSAYGQRLPVVQAQMIPGSHPFEGIVDERGVREAQAKLAECEAGLTEENTKKHALVERERVWRDKHEELRIEKNRWLGERERIGQMERQITQGELFITSRQSSLEEMERDAEEERAKEERRVRGKNRDLVEGGKLIEAHSTASTHWVDGLMSHWGHLQARIQAQCEEMASEEAMSRAQRDWNRHQAELQEAFNVFQAANDLVITTRDRAKSLLNLASNPCEGMDPADKEEMAELTEGMALRELLDAIQAERVKAELTYRANPSVIRAYAERERDVAKLRKEVEEGEERLGTLEGGMARVRGVWEPALEALIASINTGFTAAFASIGCEGEVRLARNGNEYERWGIEILVKFRDTERLQVLDGQRQSGGERSVSTILYLLAMQEMAQTPFRCVDEINQGMDPRNERKVHELLVESACKDVEGGGEDGVGPQYFLITPKLLPHLRYHERMRILCIYSGEWIPDQPLPLPKAESVSKATGAAKRAKIA